MSYPRKKEDFEKWNQLGNRLLAMDPTPCGGEYWILEWCKHTHGWYIVGQCSKFEAKYYLENGQAR